MKISALRTLCLVVFFATPVFAQDVIPLYPGTPPGSTEESYPEKQYFSKNWNTEIVTNVTRPTLTVFKPSAETKNGTAIVICPGGGFMRSVISGMLRRNSLVRIGPSDKRQRMVPFHRPSMTDNIASIGHSETSFFETGIVCAPMGEVGTDTFVSAPCRIILLPQRVLG